MSALHWVPAWSERFEDSWGHTIKTACGRRVRLPLRAGTSDRDFACSPKGRCKRCWRAWEAL